MKTENLYYELLIKYCDGLISVQDKSEDPAFRGGFYCRSCKNIHGRSIDAVFGFIEAYKLTGDKKYLEAGDSAFDYGENLMCTDGGIYNDTSTTWRYTTVFHLAAVIETLFAGKDILPDKLIKKYEARAEKMAKWLYENLDENSAANINYCTTNGLSLALAGKYFGNEAYLTRAARLVHYAAEHLTENGMLYGECQPHDKRSKKGCYGVDIGYNTEESVPALAKYAFLVGDEKLKEKLLFVLKSQLDFMFPDGGWDNSFGVRNNKWTYWGSRTSDGCQPAYLLFAGKDPAFAEAALRNTELLASCSENGLLYGGRDYARRGEYPCTHHTFEHINSLAFALENIDEKYLSPKRTEIPSDKTGGFKYYGEVDTIKTSEGEYIATLTAYDHNVTFSGHATGGTLTALYSKVKGPMIMASVTKYVLVEPTNMQQVKDIAHHRPLVPRLVREKDGKTYSTSFYESATEIRDERKKSVTYTSGLSTYGNKETLENCAPELTYTLTENGMSISIEGAEGLKFILPLIAGEVDLQIGKIEREEEIFFLTGGFIASEKTIIPENGRIELRIY